MGTGGMFHMVTLSVDTTAVVELPSSEYWTKIVPLRFILPKQVITCATDIV